ncbi:toll/interleukin-1 receptor domain-containing protein [Sphingosinicella sp. BN140058]|uniref:toll/interleukin-1 receptor domain-containing protein n=1 Tax=Sphingosinicella sp. BN140058 TaxID=1892855 RepID=UPI00101396C3|nr:toll/interleukin-1 receptor domain-containing protein [Sphingosinicella sp. BN140058]QAY78146.1 toll/interleukin-1 receptor domain-containing protein [Sphingosinicella sp. BN140058]
MTSGFISYTHADAALKEQFVRHLAPLRREGLIEVWHDAMLHPGEHLDPAVQAALAASDLVLLLVSADFIHSEYCYEQEMIRAFARQRDGTARVVPIILRPCQWKGVPVGEGQTLSEFLALPKDGLPVTSWPDRDEAFDNAAGAIREMLRSAGRPKERTAPSGTTPAPPPPAAASEPRLDTSNLGLRTKPTDLDRDRFLRAGFAATAALFELKLAELNASDAGIETDFERIDSRSFAASVYLDGKRVGQVRIWHGSDVWRNALCLSYDGAASARNSMNDWLPIEDTPQGLAFTGGNPMSRGDRQGSMDEEAAASYLWEHFLDHMQSRIR